jgi:predicted DNA-binding transcriptional regulator AlpA
VVSDGSAVLADNEADPLLSLHEAAARAGVADSTWRSYVSRERAPKPDDLDDGVAKQRRRPRWRTSTVDAFRDDRLGQGRRTDLTKSRTERRARMAAELAEPLPAPMPAMDDWLRANHEAVLEVAEALVDHREELLAATTFSDPLAEAIDAAGANITSRPSRALASAVARALGLALGLAPLSEAVRLEPDSDVRQVLVRHGRLRDEFNGIRDQKRGPA